MNDKEHTIRVVITSAPGHEPYRARVEGTKLVATCTVSAEAAVLAVANKHWHHEGMQIYTRHMGGNLWLASLRPHACYLEGDRIRYQTEQMPDPLEAVIASVGGTGVKLDGKGGAVFARWHEILGVVTPAEEASGGAAPRAGALAAPAGPGHSGTRSGSPAGAVPAPAPGNVNTADAPGAAPAAPAVVIGAAPMAAAEPGNVGSGSAAAALASVAEAGSPATGHQDRSPAGDEGQSPTGAGTDASARPCTGPGTTPETPSARPCTGAETGVAMGLVVRRDLELSDLPGTLEECAAAIRDYLGQERLGGLRAAVLIAHLRRLVFPEPKQCQEWVAWIKEHVGLERRACFRYRNVGDFLLSEAVTNLPIVQQMLVVGCTVPKLEILADLDGQKLTRFLGKHDPSGMTAEEVSDLVERYLLTSDQQKQLEADRAAREKNALSMAAKDAVRKFASIPEDRLVETAKKAGASACACQGVRLIAAGLAALDAKSADQALLGEWLDTLQECAGTIQTLRG